MVRGSILSGDRVGDRTCSERGWVFPRSRHTAVREHTAGVAPLRWSAQDSGPLDADGPCKLKGRRLPELADRVQEVVRELEIVRRDLSVPGLEEPFGDVDFATRLLEGLLLAKFRWATELPWVLCTMPSRERAAAIVATYDSGGAGAQHRVARCLLCPENHYGRAFRAWAAGGEVQPFLQQRLQGYALAPMDEALVEGVHSATHAIARKHQGSPRWWCSSVRMDENLQAEEDAVARGLARWFHLALRRWKAVLTPSPRAAAFLQPRRISEAAAASMLYGIGEAAAVDFGPLAGKLVPRMPPPVRERMQQGQLLWKGFLQAICTQRAWLSIQTEVPLLPAVEHLPLKVYLILDPEISRKKLPSGGSHPTAGMQLPALVQLWEPLLPDPNEPQLLQVMPADIPRILDLVTLAPNPRFRRGLRLWTSGGPGQLSPAAVVTHGLSSGHRWNEPPRRSACRWCSEALRVPDSAAPRTQAASVRQSEIPGRPRAAGLARSGSRGCPCHSRFG